MKLTATFLFVLCCLFGNAQNAHFSGVVHDSIDHKNLSNTVITLLHPKDSVLIKFCRVDTKGNFIINALPKGNYIFMVTHPYYADYTENIEVNSDEYKMRIIYLIPKSKLLAEVIIKTGAPIRIKGDTTEYTADSFKVKANANVEDLLRKMPGIQVDKDGKITALGEKVTKVLVDGEEFFGDDPGVATKNLRADAVDKVQVFDKKSDQATFTGIDDGKKDKTINLKLKDSKKNGYFGKAMVGGGLPDYYNSSVMVNAFKGKRKIAAYGLMGNTGATQLSWQDNTNYGGNDMVQTEFDDASGSMMMYFDGGQGDDFSGGRNGIPISKNGGLHYNNKSPNLKQSINGGYKVAQTSALGTTRVFSKIFLPDTTFNTNSTNSSYITSLKNAGNVALDIMVDSSNTLRYVAKINSKHNQSTNLFNTESLDANENYINNSNQYRSNTTDNIVLSTSLLWKHKFSKKFRTISMNIGYDWNQNNSDGLVNSISKFYKSSTSVNDTLDQRNSSNSIGRSFTTKIAYTEPLFKDAFMELSYSFNVYNNTNDKISKQGRNGKYDQQIDSLTNLYQFNRLINSPGVNFRYNKKKLNYSIGTALGFNSYQQRNITTGIGLTKDFVTLMPRASINYKVKPNSNLRFNYSGNSQAPSLEQLQPIKNNNDPLNIYEGNPNLKQSFSNNFSLSYNFWNVLKGNNLWSYINFSPRTNAFVNSSSIDRSGLRRYSTVNANGVYNVNWSSSYGIKLKKLDMNIGAGPTGTLSRDVEFINGIKSITNTSSYGISFNFNKDKEKKYNFWAGPQVKWYHSVNSSNKKSEINYWQISGNFSGSLLFHKGFEFNLESNFQARQKDPRFPSNSNRIINNAGFKKTFMNNTMELSLMVYDVFDQNKGFDRNFTSYNFSETYYTTLKRYAMLSFTWNFSKNGSKPTSF